MVKMVLSGHLGRHLEYLTFPKNDEVAPDGFGFSTLKLPRISQKTLSVPKFEVELKMSTGLKIFHRTILLVLISKNSRWSIYYSCYY